MKTLAKRLLASLSPEAMGDSVILAYHSIGSISHYSLSADAFEQQMVYLAARRKVVTLDKLIADVNSGQKSLAAITFDDGYEDNYYTVFPIMQRYNLPFAIFPVTSFVDGNDAVFGYTIQYKQLKAMTWAQLRELYDYGVVVGAHTHMHPQLSACSPDRVLQELRRSKEMLECQLSSRVNMLAYPFGQRQDFDERTKQVAQEVGYEAGFSAVPTTIGRVRDIFEIPRVTIDYCDTLSDFQQKICGKRNFMQYAGPVREKMVRWHLCKDENNRAGTVAARSQSSHADQR